ncbi:hypothetical protein [Herbidospora sp. NBRC 101105]|uniref:hypothetical protein n=1 Tax=Herbidospora sp. NBRC 101105 TaxID=3032195 RepID=UPI0024A382EC|nr:hypothetical protein [Herbidospora sp. NBRC 101105]GLX94002.1 hypothetical protein Hesp01_19520 [Herbidospora sp. NBRC 101105]
MILRTLTAAALLLGATAAPASAAPQLCREGFVFRAARPADKVCVTPATRARTLADNALKATRWADDDHACVDGYVWREAFHEDDVCVIPSVRAQARADNAAAESRRMLARLWITTEGHVVKLNGSHYNVGQVKLYVRRSGGDLVWSGVIAAAEFPGYPGGSWGKKTGLPHCSGAPDAYARAQDVTSGRWSAKVPLRTGC